MKETKATKNSIKELKDLLEQKNRELEIEAALEKVRARSMAMHKSEELQKVIDIVFEQLNNLGFSMNASMIILINENYKDIDLWIATGDRNYARKMHIPYIDNPIFNRAIEAIKNHEEFITDIYRENVARSFNEKMIQLPDWKNISEERKKFLRSIPGYARSAALCKHTGIAITNYEPKPFSEEENGILKRFAKVFEQSYTRFLDLQKAEAQAREEQIEASLERVRSKAMAMHSSADLSSAASVVFTELKKLGVNPIRSGVGLFNKESRKVQLYSATSSESGDSLSLVGWVELENHPVLEKIYETWLQQEDYFPELQGEQLRKYYQLLLAGLSVPIPDFKKNQKQFGHFIPFPIGCLYTWSDEHFNEEQVRILKRFASIVDLTFRRYLDLVKAEEQAREAQIEAALEKVRATAMAMQESTELNKVISEVSEQLTLLGFDFDISNIGTDISPEGFYIWNASPAESIISGVYVPYKNLDFIKWFYSNREKDTPVSTRFTKAQKNAFFRHYFTKTEGKNLSPERKKYVLDGQSLDISTVHKREFTLNIHNYRGIIYSDEQNQILQRFANVFEQAYARFLDLKKAEAQAREAHIEAALERVRSHSIGMQKSEELRKIIQVIFEQFKQLGFNIDSAGFATDYRESDDFNIWFADSNSVFPNKIHIPYFDHPQFIRYKEAKEKGLDFYTSNLTFEEKNKLFDHIFKISPPVPKELKDMAYSSPGYMSSHVFLKNVVLYILNYSSKPFSEDENEILKRFAKVFEQTYTRFLDLQKAEAQAREAQIEAALERIRSRSLGMQNSGELQNVVSVVFEQLQSLDFALDGAAFIGTRVENFLGIDFWMEDKITQPACFRLPYYDAPSINDIYEAWDKGKDFIAKIYGKEKNIWFEHAFKHTELNIVPEDRIKWILEQSHLTQAVAFGKNSVLGIHAHHIKKLTDNEIDILKRFSKVFEQGYVRFLDLKKAEEQAREAQIEAALERVRAKTMAMYKSEELQEVVHHIFEEMAELGVDMTSAVVTSEFNEKHPKKGVNMWVATYDDTYFKKIYMPHFNHPVWDNIIHNLEKKKKFYTEIFNKKEKDDFFSYLFKHTDLKYAPEERKQMIFESPGMSRANVLSKNAGLFVMKYTDKPFSDEANNIVKRFGKVFEQTFTRFLDLQKAEAQAREAVKQASLDRVRGEIASMRTSKDLDRITPVIWRELQALEVPFIRCGVFIIDEQLQNVNVYLSTPEGKALAALHLAFDANDLTKNTLEHWRTKRIFKTHWNKEEFLNWTKSMIKMGQVKNAETYQGSSSAPESLNLHFVPFRQGMLYVGDVSPLPDEKIELVKTLSESFSIAYARYEDFKQLEEAKNKIEITLNDLRAAQTQLVQAEKMASLGELTAGIAHEIQNPLNFVNNFSELSNELLEELKEEIKSGNIEEVQVLVEDVIQNLEKINNHGQRASSIVKGMLLHSRGSSGQREMTDINALCDEYLRLSYHGFRAKDKSFNADFKMEADESLPKIEIVPQDIGRVLLNLINNAFYAVSSKALATEDQNFKPLVMVRTTSSKSSSGDLGVKSGAVEIRISDNGPGIPEQVRDKIFQPFFTTKPTGQGTGLGLSLSYDIVKAHGGSITVESNENKGTEFIIQILLKN